MEEINVIKRSKWLDVFPEPINFRLAFDVIMRKVYRIYGPMLPTITLMYLSEEISEGNSVDVLLRQIATNVISERMKVNIHMPRF